MKYCEECGAQLNDDDIFCVECGTKVSVITVATDRITESIEVKLQNVNNEEDKNEEVSNITFVSKPQQNLSENERNIERALPYIKILMVIGILLVIVMIVVVLSIKNDKDKDKDKDINYATNNSSTIDNVTQETIDSDRKTEIDSDEEITKENATSEIENVNNISANTAGNELVSNAGEYILPNSSSERLDKTDLSELTQDQFRLARNEIYARHGRRFQDQELQAYFYSKSWYEPLCDDVSESELSQIEKDNLKLIKEYENNAGILTDDIYDRIEMIPGRYIDPDTGSWGVSVSVYTSIEDDGMPGKDEYEIGNVVFFDDKEESEYYSIILTKDGNYEVKDGSGTIYFIPYETKNPMQAWITIHFGDEYYDLVCCEYYDS